MTNKLQTTRLVDLSLLMRFSDVEHPFWEPRCSWTAFFFTYFPMHGQIDRKGYIYRATIRNLGNLYFPCAPLTVIYSLYQVSLCRGYIDYRRLLGLSLLLRLREPRCSRTALFCTFPMAGSTGRGSCRATTNLGNLYRDSPAATQ